MEKCKYSKAESNPEKENDIVDVKKSTWSNFWVKAKLLAPYLWPRNNRWLQARVVFCVILLLSLRVINLYVPRINKMIIDSLAEQKFPYQLILIFTVVKIFQGGTGACQMAGLVNCLKNILWIRVEQNTTKTLKLGLFSHLHRLGVRWHQSRKTGEVLRVMDRGSTSVTTVLNTIFFQITPILIDVAVAMVALSYDLNIYFGLIILITMIIYLTIAVIGTEYRTKFKRKMNEADNEQRARSVDSLLNSETVKLYGNEDYESGVFSDYMDRYQRKEWQSLGTMYAFSQNQTFTLNIGLMVGSLYCANLISEGVMTVGDYVLFGTYMMQLMQPLNQLATLYRTIQEAMIDMENMMTLMNQEQEITDIAEAPQLNSSKSEIMFDNVSFSYDIKQPILKNISCQISEGSTLAIVGPSGSGKSTFVKLLLRFYDPTEGKISVGGQNIRFVQQTSLRKSIGVVPQDTVLFNETIGYNINYGKVEADQSEMENAAKISEIHDKILSLPDGYDTKVGERGLKISGGEKQRVAMARTLLSNPNIIVLDEATSSLDTATEKAIQDTLTRVLTGKTCVMVAHRLSTVVDADQIIVMDQGEILEKGTHAELLALNGKYAEMWNIQKVASGTDCHC